MKLLSHLNRENVEFVYLNKSRVLLVHNSKAVLGHCCNL